MTSTRKHVYFLQEYMYIRRHIGLRWLKDPCRSLVSWSFGAMSSNSSAVFAGRIKELGLGEYTEKFVDHGWDTYQAFAFASSHQPTSSDDSSFLADVVGPILGNLSHPLKAKLKYLHFESFTITANELKQRTLRSEDEDKPRKLPALERQERLNKIRIELSPGIEVRGEFEPSYGLIDKFASMADEGTLRFVPWSDYGRRDQEVRGAKNEQYFKADANGTLKEQSRLVEIEADISTDLRLERALQRRGIALQVAKLMSFKTHQLWVGKLFLEYHREPMRNYEKVTLEQVQDADASLFAELSELSNASLTSLIPGVYPLDALLPIAMANPRVIGILVGLPAFKRAAAPANTDRPAKMKKTDKKGKGKGSGGGKSSGKSGGGKNKGDGILPKALEGLNATHKGKRICFGFNIAGCNAKTYDGACHKGLHVCARCGSSNHAQTSDRCSLRKD